MLDVEIDAETGTVEMLVDGSISTTEYRCAVAAIDALLKTHKHVNVVEIVRSVGWVAPSVWWHDIAFHFSHHHFLHRVAIVTDLDWVTGLSRLFAPLVPGEVRLFGESDLAAARDWARHGDGKPVTSAHDDHYDFA